MSCLQFGFYLASWGMMRGDLHKRNVLGLVPVVELIAGESASTWELDAHTYIDQVVEVIDLRNRIQEALESSEVQASDILVTKTMLGSSAVFTTVGG